MASFYLVLPSNVSGGTLSDFTVRLPDRISLDGSWEVALVEISYQNSWFNVSDKDDGRFSVINFAKSQQMVEGFVPLNHYETVDHLIFAMKAALLKLKEEKGWEDALALSFRYDTASSRVVVKTYEPHCYLFLSQKLSYMLGFDDMRITKRFKTDGQNRISVAEHPPDMRAGFYSMYVYCNLVGLQIVGDKFAPLLRTLSVNGHFGDNIDKDFINPHYVPVLKQDFDNVEINIKSDTGACVPFNFGKTILKLHFRKRRQ